MTFLDQMHALMDLQKTFPHMVWDVETGKYSGSEIRINIQIDDETAELIRQARLMFAPV